MNEASQILSNQRELFLSGRTRDLAFRKKTLKLLEKNIRLAERKIFDALERDLGKCAFEGFVSEVGMVLDEIGLARKHLRRWSRPRRVRTPLSLMPGKSLIYREPYGSSLVISPWNYPLHQLMGKVAPALAAGCIIVAKPATQTPLQDFIMAEIFEAVGLPAGVFNLVSGSGSVIGPELSGHPGVDMVSFTGSTHAGIKVAQAAAPTVKRVCQELGGKSPYSVPRARFTIKCA